MEPLRPAPQPAVTIPSPPAQRAGPHVLVVDDDPAVTRAYSRILAHAGFVVDAVLGGKEAAALLQRNSYDVILSDVDMPEMDGVALLRLVRQRDLDVPVLLISGAQRLETALQAMEHGALRYLCKPIPRDELTAAVDHAARLHAMARLKREALDLVGGSTLRMGDRATLEATFARALDGLFMVFQPIVRAAQGSVFAYEALMRTREPVLGSPMDLLGAAERLGQVHLLSRQVRALCAQAMDALPGDCNMFINLHPQDLLDPQLLDPAAPLSRHAARVVLELTERASLEDIPDVPERARALKARGFRLALDDLGAGYAGLATFSQLNPDVVKLDMGLVRNLHRDATRHQIVSGMTRLCREMGILVVAEGVETQDECDALLRIGPDFLQGYLLARPGPRMDYEPHPLTRAAA